MQEQLRPTLEINHDVFLVQGANRSAIYDTNLGNVYSINKAASEIILNRRVGTDFYSQLKQSGLTGEQITKFTPEKPECGLEFMWLVLTPKCNLRCIHCYEESTPNQQPKLALTLPFWKKIIEQGSQIGCKRVQFIGGEPLVYAEIFELMKHARSLGFEFVEIFTNGTLLTPEKVLRLKELDIHVAISLYSNAPLIHDQITTVPGSFEKTLRALRLLKGKDIPTRIGVIIMRQNQESIESTLELIKNLGFDAENSLDVVRPFGRGKSKDLIPSETTQHQFGLTSSPSFTTNRNDFLHHQFFNPCLAGKIAVDSTGNISPCIATSEITVGRTTQDLMDTVYGDALQTLWSISKDNIETCCVCEYRYACGDCRPLAQAETGDLYGKTGRCTYDPHTGQWHDKIQA